MNHQKEKEPSEQAAAYSRLTEKASELRKKSRATTKKLEELKRKSDDLLHPAHRKLL